MGEFWTMESGLIFPDFLLSAEAGHGPRSAVESEDFL